MGARISIVAVQDARPTIYYDHWGAIYLIRSLFFGPAPALEYIRSLKQETSLMNEIWAEGVALLDLDRCRLAFHLTGPELHAKLRETLLALMRINWPRWSVEWAHGGIAEVADSIGHDSLDLRLKFDPHNFQPLTSLSVECEWAQTLITIKDGNRAYNVGFRGQVITNLLVMGPDLPRAVKNFPPFPFREPELVEDFEAGAMIDCNERRVEFWNTWGWHHERYLHLIREQWPGWAITIHREGLPGQWARSGRDVTQVLIGENGILRHIVGLLIESPGVESQAILDQLQASGENVVPIDPDRFKSLDPATDRQDRAAILARSIAEYRRTSSTSTETTA